MGLNINKLIDSNDAIVIKIKKNLYFLYLNFSYLRRYKLIGINNLKISKKYVAYMNKFKYHYLKCSGLKLVFGILPLINKSRKF